MTSHENADKCSNADKYLQNSQLILTFRALAYMKLYQQHKLRLWKLLWYSSSAQLYTDWWM